jgi:hypothetical protein
MKKHELIPGEDRCKHCHGTSSTPIECVERMPSQSDIAEFSSGIPTIENNEPVFRFGGVGTYRARVKGHQDGCNCEVCRMFRNS